MHMLDRFTVKPESENIVLLIFACIFDRTYFKLLLESALKVGNYGIENIDLASIASFWFKFELVFLCSSVFILISC